MAAAVPDVELIKAFSNPTMFNGLTTFDNYTVLIGEGRGSAIKLNILTGDSSIAVQNASMSSPNGSPITLGIDGLRYYNGSLYYSNIFAGTLRKVSINASGNKAGEVTTLLKNQQANDLCIGPDGSIYVTTNNKNKIIKFTLDGKSSTIGTVTTGTSCAYDRRDSDSNVLYISSGAGGLYSLKFS